MIQPIEPRKPDSLMRAPHHPEPDKPPHPFLVLHRLLRHRYRWCLLLAIACGTIGLFIGYKATRPLYRCDGFVQTKPWIPQVLAQIPENGYLQNMASFIDLQMTLMRSDRVIARAMQDPDWRRLERPAGDNPLDQFRDSLTIKTPNKVSQMITVSFLDPDPKATQAAVKALLTAYNEIHVEGEIRAEETKRQLLEQRRAALTEELRQKQEAIRRAVAQYGTDNLRALGDMKTEHLQRLENSLSDVEFALASLGAAKAEAGGKPAADHPAAVMAAEIAVHDTTAARLMNELRKLQTDLQAQSRHLGPQHPMMQQLRAEIEAKQNQVTEYAIAWNTAQAKTGMSAGIGTAQSKRTGTIAASLAGLSAAELKLRQDRYKEMIAQARRESSELGWVMLDVERMGREKTDILHRLEETRRRLDLLNFESPLQGRVQLASLGEQPVLDKDKRVPLAIVGGLGGAGAGVGLVLLFALLDRRLRSPDDAHGNAGPLLLLGALPTLPDNSADPEQTAIAAHCVHQIRAMLQVTSGTQGRRVYALTSPTAGAGKTSLTLALGASFAAANFRTLMVDCDVLGQGLSARVGRVARRRLGQILLRSGQITEPQLERALAAAAQSRRPLGETLVQTGQLSQERIAEALDVQARSSIGLLDALIGESLDECIAETGVRGLFVLPAGTARPEDVSVLSPESLGVLMEKVRARFDIILVDTGPVLGSLEASVLGSVVDGTVVVLSRGQSRAMAERAIRHLRDIGAPISGMVFNRADARDLRNTSATSRVSSFVRGTSCPAQNAAMGPLATVVHKRSDATNENLA